MKLSYQISQLQQAEAGQNQFKCNLHSFATSICQQSSNEIWQRKNMNKTLTLGGQTSKSTVRSVDWSSSRLISFLPEEKMPPVEEWGSPRTLAPRNEGLRGLWPRRILPASSRRTRFPCQMSPTLQFEQGEEGPGSYPERRGRRWWDTCSRATLTPGT